MRKNLMVLAALLTSVLSGCAVYPYQSTGYGRSYSYYDYSRPVWAARFDNGPSMRHVAPPPRYSPPPHFDPPQRFSPPPRFDPPSRGPQPGRGFEPGPRPSGDFHGDHHRR